MEAFTLHLPPGAAPRGNRVSPGSTLAEDTVKIVRV